ncbi:hypothetical protein [Granulicatella seriolae]|uniref:PRC-barrel domain-containing protein n=1 Tax=Granulicatella seriolae TaxID=2967226 RepID=A0ABT1WL15_9LACT|nr:hypothetical protein [Granulicatella seriolae]
MNKALSCRTIVGTSIIEIEQGVGLGSVQQVVVDQGVSLTFIIKTTDEANSYALLPSSQIYGIGNYAAMIQNQSVLRSISEDELNTLISNQGAIVEELVITIEGDKVGKVTDFFIDGDHEIGYLLVESDTGNNLQIDKDQLQMIGKEYIILNTNIKDNFKEVLGHSPSDSNVSSELDLFLHGENSESEFSTQTNNMLEDNLFNIDIEEDIVAEELQVSKEELNSPMEMQDFFQGSPSIIEDIVEPEPIEVSYRQQQKSLLVGQKTSKDLYDEDGLVLVEAGTIITESTINLLRKIDRKLLVKLAGCVVDDEGNY